jgi:hypothetical protein
VRVSETDAASDEEDVASDEDDAAGGNGPPRARHSVDERWLLAAAVAVPMVTLPFVAASLIGRRALGAALIGTALLVLLVIIVARRQWVQTSAAFILALIVVIGGMIVIWGPSAWLGLTQEASVTMISPSSDNPNPQPGCVPLRFSGTPPTGEVYVVANREQGNPRYFFQGQVFRNPNTGDWISNIQIGQTGKRDGGKTFYIYVYVMAKSSADYMTNAVPLNGASNWSSLVPPPDATPVGGITVIRDNDNKTCRSGP